MILRGTMLPMALHQFAAARLLFCLCSSLAAPLSLYSSTEGSADEEDLGGVASSVPTTSLLYEYHTTPVGHVHVETDFLTQVVNFLEKNTLLVAVATSLILLVFLVTCGAMFMSRRRKVNAYYPSSFPAKMYVDRRDKTGGAKLFHEVPEKASPQQESEPVDSHKQLQADIMRAAKSLRTPNKSAEAAEGSENSQRGAERSPGDGLDAHGSLLDQQLPSFPEEEPSQLSDDEAATAGGGTEQLSPPEQPSPPPEQKLEEEEDSETPPPQEEDSEKPGPEEEDSQAPLTGRSLRPSSLHIHNDSATLQLLEGEKTAF